VTGHEQRWPHVQVASGSCAQSETAWELVASWLPLPPSTAISARGEWVLDLIPDVEDPADAIAISGLRLRDGLVHVDTPHVLAHQNQDLADQLLNRALSDSYGWRLLARLAIRTHRQDLRIQRLVVESGMGSNGQNWRAGLLKRIDRELMWQEVFLQVVAYPDVNVASMALHLADMRSRSDNEMPVAADVFLHAAASTRD
jgi:hypothetical protein